MATVRLNSVCICIIDRHRKYIKLHVTNTECKLDVTETIKKINLIYYS